MLLNASPLEVGWTVFAFFGTFPSVALLYRAVAIELTRHRLKVNGSLEASLHKDIAVGLVFLIVAGCFLVGGMTAMQAPPSSLAATDPSAAISPIVIPIAFMIANVAVTFGAGYCLLQQHALDHDIRAAVRRDRRATDRAFGEPLR